MDARTSLVTEYLTATSFCNFFACLESIDVVWFFDTFQSESFKLAPLLYFIAKYKAARAFSCISSVFLKKKIITNASWLTVSARSRKDTRRKTRNVARKTAVLRGGMEKRTPAIPRGVIQSKRNFWWGDPLFTDLPSLLCTIVMVPGPWTPSKLSCGVDRCCSTALNRT